MIPDQIFGVFFFIKRIEKYRFLKNFKNSDVLINGRVEYGVKFLGCSEVAGAQGSNLVSDALNKIKFQLDVGFSIFFFLICIFSGQEK